MDTGASSHIINDRSKFKSFDSTFKPERHSMELANGKRTVGVAQGRGDAQVCLLNSEVIKSFTDVYTGQCLFIS